MLYGWLTLASPQPVVQGQTMSQNPPPSCWPCWPSPPCRFECGTGDVNNVYIAVAPAPKVIILAEDTRVSGRDCGSTAPQKITPHYPGAPMCCPSATTALGYTLIIH